MDKEVAPSIRHDWSGCQLKRNWVEKELVERWTRLDARFRAIEMTGCAAAVPVDAVEQATALALALSPARPGHAREPAFRDRP